ncbi:unnamed protein product, partial [marine sediment metagenome]
GFVEQMLDTYETLVTTINDADRILVQKQIEIIDRQIDRQVYSLYSLTAEDIKIIEGER